MIGINVRSLESKNMVSGCGQGDILEDVELVESLEETKRTATSVTEQVRAAILIDTLQTLNPKP